MLFHTEPLHVFTYSLWIVDISCLEDSLLDQPGNMVPWIVLHGNSMAGIDTRMTLDQEDLTNQSWLIPRRNDECCMGHVISRTDHFCGLIGLG